MAFSLQKHIFSKTALIAASVIIAATSTFFITLQNYSSYKASGYSMLPNYWPEQIITGHKNFSDVKRHQVYMTSENKYMQITGGIAAGNVSTKRVVGMPGDALVFHRESGALLSINNTTVVYSENTAMKSLKTTDTHQGISWHTPAFHYADALGGRFSVYQILPGQQANATADVKISMAKYTQFQFLNRISSVSHTDTVTVHLSEDEYFLLSDNRTVGVDSRYYGPVGRKDFLFEVDTEATPLLAHTTE